MRAFLATVVLFSGFAFAQTKAWRDLNFGMTSDEVQAALSEYPDFIRDPFLTNGTLFMTGSLYRLTFLWPNNLLGRVELESPKVTASDYERLLLTHRQTLVDILTTAYGQPKVAEVGFLDLRPGVTWTHTWPVTDGVRRMVGIRLADFQFSAVLWVEDAERVDAWNASRAAQRSSEVEDAAGDF